MIKNRGRRKNHLFFFFQQLQTLLSSTTTEHSLGQKNPNTTPQSSAKTQQKKLHTKTQTKTIPVFTFQYPFHSFRQPQLTQRALFVKEGFKFLLEWIKSLTSNLNLWATWSWSVDNPWKFFLSTTQKVQQWRSIDWWTILKTSPNLLGTPWTMFLSIKACQTFTHKKKGTKK